MPSVSDRQQRFMGADLERAREGKKTVTGMSEAQLEDFARKRHHHNSNPKETRESGDNLVLIADGGGPFQAYGPRASEPDACAAYEDQRDTFSMALPDKIQRLKLYPRRQIVDNGGNT